MSAEPSKRYSEEEVNRRLAAERRRLESELGLAELKRELEAVRNAPPVELSPEQLAAIDEELRAEYEPKIRAIEIESAIGSELQRLELDPDLRHVVLAKARPQSVEEVPRAVEAALGDKPGLADRFRRDRRRYYRPEWN